MALVLAGLALVVGLLGLVAPRLIRPIYVGWMIAAFPIGWVMSHVVQALILYGLFTPVALVFRLIGRDALYRAGGPRWSAISCPRRFRPIRPPTSAN